MISIEKLEGESNIRKCSFFFNVLWIDVSNIEEQGFSFS